MTCEDKGNLLSYDGAPISFDALPEHKYKVIFSKIPNTIFFLQSFSFPGVSVEKFIHHTPYMDIDEVGEKIIYEPFKITFLVDAQMNNHFEIYNWMKRMTVQGSNVDEVSDAVLMVNDSRRINFTDCWPGRLDGIQFVSTSNEPNYVVCTATFNYDYYHII